MSLYVTVELPPAQTTGEEEEACPDCGAAEGLASVYRDGGYWHYCTACRASMWRNPRAWDDDRRRPLDEWRYLPRLHWRHP